MEEKRTIKVETERLIPLIIVAIISFLGLIILPKTNDTFIFFRVFLKISLAFIFAHISWIKWVGKYINVKTLLNLFTEKFQDKLNGYELLAYAIIFASVFIGRILYYGLVLLSIAIAL